MRASCFLTDKNFYLGSSLLVAPFFSACLIALTLALSFAKPGNCANTQEQNLQKSEFKLNKDNLDMSTNVAMCAQCHGTNGLSEPSSGIPSLAGMQSSVFLQRMQQYRLDNPSSSVMARLARGLTQDQINRAATYFQSLDRH
jgi:cytochrome c553